MCRHSSSASFARSSNVAFFLEVLIFTSLIQRAREFGAVRKAQPGSVSFIQRFDSALRLNLHIHAWS